MLDGVVIADPKGMIPKWMVNMFQKDWPLSTLRAIRLQVKKTDVFEHPSYKNALK